MITKDHKDIAQWAMEIALKNRCSSARVSIMVAYNNSFEFRNTQLDKLHQSAENKLYIELYIDGRYGTLATNRLERNELEKLIREGILSTRFLAPDLCRQLPNPNRYYKKTAQDDLKLYDTQYFNYTVDQKLDLAKATVEEVYDTDDRIVSVVSSYDDGCSFDYTIASNGFESEEQDSAFSLTAEVALKTDTDARPESYWYDSKIYLEDLKKQGIAKKALSRALQKLGQRKIKSGKYNILLDNTVSSRLLNPLISAMYGSAIQQKNTFLLNKLGQQITSNKLSLIDKPHTPKTFGARWFDKEGIATKQQNIIEEGVLKTYFIDTYNSLKLNVEPTISSPSIITLDLGSKCCQELIAVMQDGIWITGFNGGNTNSTTGDFSFGIEGFLVEKGIVTQPISEMNITGNILVVWNNLIEIGNDPFSFNSSRQIPSLLFEEMSVSGL